MKPKKIKISNENIDVVYGLIWGDGSITKSGGPKNKNSRLDIVHCKKQKEYLEFKKDLLDQLEIPCKISVKRTTKNNYSRDDYQYRLDTTANEFWTEMRAKFYSFRNTDNKIKKRITKNILDKCSIRTLCILFLDDGYSNPKKNQIQIGVYGLSVEEAELVKDWIYNITGILFKVNVRKGKPFLTNYKNAPEFKNLLLSSFENIPSCMLYKLK